MESAVTPGLCHRIAFAADAATGEQIIAFADRVLGADTIAGGSRQRQDLPMGAGEVTGGSSGTRWIGSVPLVVLSPAPGGSPLDGYLARYGAGLHSLAWTVDDLWLTERAFAAAGVRVSGYEVPARAVFTHPRDTGGVLVEWTDSEFVNDPREGGTLTGGTPALVANDGVAWVTAVVRDVEASAAALSTAVAATRVEAGPTGPADAEDTLDLLINDITLRLVAPRSAASRYGAVLDARGEGLWAPCIAVPDLATATAQLQAAGVGVLAEDAHRAWTEPADTAGVPWEWAVRPR